MLDVFERLFGAVDGAWFERRDGHVVMAYPPAPLPSFNGVWVDDDAALGGLEVALSDVRRRGVAPGVMAFDTPSAIAVAHAHGLIETESIPAMLLEGDDFEPVAATCDVDEDALAEAQALVVDSFGIPSEWFDPMYDRATLDRFGGHVYVLREDGRAVSTALAIPTDDGVGIFNVATPKAERGRGLGAAVTSCAIAAQFERGRSFAFLQTSELGEPVYRRLGFRHVGSYTLAFAPPH